MILLVNAHSLGEGACRRASIRLLHLWKTRLWEVSGAHCRVHGVLRRGDILLVIVISAESVGIGLLESAIEG